jgi:hypothetical protein
MHLGSEPQRGVGWALEICCITTITSIIVKENKRVGDTGFVSFAEPMMRLCIWQGDRLVLNAAALANQAHPGTSHALQGSHFEAATSSGVTFPMTGRKAKQAQFEGK